MATPIEQQVNGVDNMIYMKSLNTSDGRMLLDVSFQVEMDRDMANVLTQNRVSQAQSRLPQEVTQQGVTVKKINPSILNVISLYSPNGTYDAQFLNNYAMINVRDAILRVQGVAQVDLLRWGRVRHAHLAPARPAGDARDHRGGRDLGDQGAEPPGARREGRATSRPRPGRNSPTRCGRPAGWSRRRNSTTSSCARPRAAGSSRIKDVGRTDLGSENYRSFGRLDGKPAGVLAVYLLPGANQIKSAEGIYHTLDELKAFFPADMDYKITYDTTPAVEASIESILHTLVEAFILVTLVVFIFLQSLRATLIPLLTVPVSLIGTFIFFPLLGFSLNTLTMFGLVLAIGIVVDDAIVVVEAVIHHIQHGMNPHDATVQAMKEVSGPVVAIALILSAVFVPVALLGGLTGRIYQQFALTIAISVLLSAFSALSLSPALAAMILKAESGPPKGPLGAFFRWFNKLFDRTTTGYVKWTRVFVRRTVLALLVVAGSGVRRGSVREDAARRLRAGRGPGHLHDQRPAAAGLVSATHRQSAPADRRNPGEDRGGGCLQCHRRAGHAHQQLQPGVRLILLPAEAVG